MKFEREQLERALRELEADRSTFMLELPKAEAFLLIKLLRVLERHPSLRRDSPRGFALVNAIRSTLESAVCDNDELRFAASDGAAAAARTTDHKQRTNDYD